MVLETLNKGKATLMELARNSGMSRSGFQNIVDDFRNARLIEQAEHRSFYKLTPKGKEVIEFTKKFSEKLEPAEKRYREEQLKQTLSKFGSGLSKDEIMEILKDAGITDDGKTL